MKQAKTVAVKNDFVLSIACDCWVSNKIDMQDQLCDHDQGYNVHTDTNLSL